VAPEPSPAGLSDMNVDLDVKVLSFGNPIHIASTSLLKNLLFNI
jgi:hypothetical protein